MVAGRLALFFAGGTLGGILLAALVTWVLLAPIASYYRRGGLSIVSSFATVILMVVTLPIHELFGRAGLAALASACFVLALALAVLARRAAAAP